MSNLVRYCYEKKSTYLMSNLVRYCYEKKSTYFVVMQIFETLPTAKQQMLHAKYSIRITDSSKKRRYVATVNSCKIV
jgi:hypothetical protein